MARRQNALAGPPALPGFSLKRYIMQSIRILVASATLLALCIGRGDAQPIVIGPDQGAVFDAILDGFPMLAVLDGTPDFGGNALAISLQAGVTEERGIGEFPLAALAGAAPEDIAHATLSFDIDDVLGTFGPGTGFSGNACEEILVHLYAGDGAVQLADFTRIEAAPHVVDTRPLGRITDTTLRTSGPLRFDVDVTVELRELLASGSAAVGVIWRTMDTPTGTSIDNLGEGSAGPPGVGRSFMPHLTIELGAPPTQTPTATPIPNTPTTTATTGFDATRTSTSLPGACAGDCNGDGAVAVNELVLGVNMALGNPATCAAMDDDHNGQIGIAELVRAVGSALNGC